MTLYTGTEWTFEKIDKVWKAIDKIGKEELKLDYYEPQIEMITSEQMLDAYSSHAMPVMYNHWSFGKSLVANEYNYKMGRQGLAYEVVINTDPCLAYLMEDNTMTMQTLVLAHAVCGHGSFFKNNYLFKYWTDASAILDYLVFAKNYIKDCEVKYGEHEVEEMLDACHALQYCGIDKYRRPAPLKKEERAARKRKWMKYIEETFYDLWRTLPEKEKQDLAESTYLDDRDFPEENILYFMEKNSLHLSTWQKEIIRIVRKISQYFYPQMQTKMMNEGWASFVHYEIMTRLHDQGQISEGAYLEFLANHTAVCCQRDFDEVSYSGLNVYALGCAMFQDIKRMCVTPDEEDKKWFPDIVNTNWRQTLDFIVKNFRDESFILQYLSPKIIRRFKLFAFHDNPCYNRLKVVRVHTDEDVRALRKHLSKQWSLTYNLPQIEIAGVDWRDDRCMHLNHIAYDGVRLKFKEAKATLEYIEKLWGHPVELLYIDESGHEIDEV